MKSLKHYAKRFLQGILLLGIYWVLLAPKIPCVPYFSKQELLLLLKQAKQKDSEALNNLTGFLSLGGDKKNALLGQCAQCQLHTSRLDTKRYCNKFLKKVDCPDSAIEKIKIEKSVFQYIDHLWCKMTHIF